MAKQDGGSSPMLAGPKLRSTKEKMPDYECIVCEFVNEGNTVAVGYRSWLETENTDAELDDIIATGKTVKVKWPNVNIGPPSTAMTKKLAKCKWQVSAAKIIGRGGWTDMCNWRTNLEKYGVPNPEKSQRKFIQRREENENSSQNSEKKTAKTSTKRAEASHKASKQEDILRKYKAQKHSQAVISDESAGSSEETQKPPNEEYSFEVSRLKKENSKLKAEISELKALTIVSNDLLEMKKISMSVLDNLKSIEEITAAPLSNKISAGEADQSAKPEYEDPILKAADAFLTENRLDQTQSLKRQINNKTSSAVPLQSQSACVSAKIKTQTDQTVLERGCTKKISPQSTSTSCKGSSFWNAAESQGIRDTAKTDKELFDQYVVNSILKRSKTAASTVDSVTLQTDTTILNEEILREAEVIIHSDFTNDIVSS